MNIISQIQDYCEDHYDVTLTKKQMIFFVILLVLIVFCMIYVTTAEKVVVDKDSVQTTPPSIDALLFEKK